jgi:teichoic acid transport system ATP-binding protein
VIIEDVVMEYSILEDRRPPTLKRFMSKRGRSRTPRTVRAVDDVSFELKEGEALGLIGRNGAGKTTLLRGVAGLLPLTGGRVLARSEPVLLGVGAALHPELSGRRNVFLGATALGMSRVEVDERLEEIVTFAGVEDFVDMPLRAYSSGMMARLRFAIASAVEPDILLIDEALNVGDRAFRKRSQERMEELLDRAGAIVLVSHSLSSVRDICTRVIWLDRGKVVLDGLPDDVISAYEEGIEG